MIRKINTKSFVLSFILFFLFFVSFAAAADLNSEQVTRDLVTQTDLLEQSRGERLKAPAGKPLIEEEKREQRKQEKGPVFFVKKIRLEGNTLLGAEELEALVRPFENRQLAFGELQELTDRITALYRRYSYTTTYAYIPPQKVADGIVEIRVVEGKVGEIHVEGNRWFKQSLYRKAIPFAESAFFDIAGLETALREINIQPDRAVKAYLEPGKAAGTTDIILKTEDHFPLHASYEFNRRGTKLTHRSRHILHLTHNNLLGFSDRFETAFTLAEQGAILGSIFNYEFPVQSTGTIFSFAAAVAQSRLQGDLRELDVKGQSFSLVPGVTQKIWYGPRHKLDWSLRAEIKDSKTSVGDDKLSYDRMRVITTGPRLKLFDAWGQTLSAADVHVGIPHLMGGSSKNDPNASRLESGGQFVYGTATLARLQPLPWEMLGVIQAIGQYSPVPLTSLEQMNLGGMYSIRGYPENDSSGDNGYSLSAEVRVPAYFFPREWTVPGFNDKTWRHAVSLVGFIDGGQVFNYKRQIAGSEKVRTLLGTGFGARLYLSPDFNIQFDYGIPFGDDSSDKDKPQIHLSARIGF